MKRFKLGKSHMNVNSVTSVFSLKGYLRGIPLFSDQINHSDPKVRGGADFLRPPPIILGFG